MKTRGVHALFWRALIGLSMIQLRLWYGGFPIVYARLKRSAPAPICAERQVLQIITRRVCRSVDSAAAWCIRKPECFPKSAATALLLRRLGVPADVVLGICYVPLEGHAWVEVEGEIVNDDAADIRARYLVLDRI